MFWSRNTNLLIRKTPQVCHWHTNKKNEGKSSLQTFTNTPGIHWLYCKRSMNCWKKTTYDCWWFRNPDNPLQYVKPYKFSIYQLLIFRNFLGKHQLFEIHTGSQFPTRGPATRGEIPRHTKHLRLGVENKPSPKGNDCIPTIDFQGRAVSCREEIRFQESSFERNLLWYLLRMW